MSHNAGWLYNKILRPMKWRLLIFLIAICNLTSLAQDKDLWESFYDAKTELIGFKDTDQNVKISPKFNSGFTVAKRFDKIIAVTEQVDSNNYSSYYLLKNGNQIGKDSIYLWDNSPDCESEGKIRFRDNKTDKVGFFDKNGYVVIPAIYNDAQPFRNGVAIAIMNAKKECLDGKIHNDDNCEHWGWKGGQIILIDDSNKTLIDDFIFSDELDWFSLNIVDATIDTTIRDYFKERNGKYYSFINFEKDFKVWFKSNFLNSTDLKNIKDNCFFEITYWSDSENEWISKETDEFLNENKEILIQKISEFQKGVLEYAIFMDGLNPFIFNKEIYSSFFDFCGNPITWKYPVFDVVVSYNSKEGRIDYQDHFEFLRTNNGYKLLGLSIESMKIK
jgi:hypothetical protein